MSSIYLQQKMLVHITFCFLRIVINLPFLLPETAGCLQYLFEFYRLLKFNQQTSLFTMWASSKLMSPYKTLEVSDKNSKQMPLNSLGHLFLDSQTEFT